MGRLMGRECGGRGRPPHNNLEICPTRCYVNVAPAGINPNVVAQANINLNCCGAGVLACGNSCMGLQRKREGWGASWEEIVAGGDARPTRERDVVAQASPPAIILLPCAHIP